MSKNRQKALKNIYYIVEWGIKMNKKKLPISICVGDFYLVGKIDISDIEVSKVRGGYTVKVFVNGADIKRLDDKDLMITKKEVNSNVIQINFETGEKKWV
jgi:hypothetical protein